MPKPFVWNTKRTRAAMLLAEGQTEATTALALGINPLTLWRWKKHPEFSARIQSNATALRAAIVARGIADRQNRVDALNERWLLMQRVIQKRAQHPEYAGAPGGKTGLLVKTVKAVGQGKDIEIIDEYSVDVALLRELRAHEQQAAQELGQWTEKRELSTKDNKPLTVMVIRGVSMDEL